MPTPATKRTAAMLLHNLSAHMREHDDYVSSVAVHHVLTNNLCPLDILHILRAVRHRAWTDRSCAMVKRVCAVVRWIVLRKWFHTRRIAVAWFEYTAHHYGPDGAGRVRDLEAFERDPSFSRPVEKACCPFAAD